MNLFDKKVTGLIYKKINTLESEVNIMSYLDYRKLPKKIYYVAIAVVVLCSIFLAGAHTGRIIQQEQDRLYVGRVIAKEYLPEEVKEDPETKSIEKYDEQYLVKVEDHAGDIVVMNVTKEEFNQIDIGEKLKR